MASITLRDLMDPLSKIAAATEKTSIKIDALATSLSNVNIPKNSNNTQKNSPNGLNSIKKESIPVINEFIASMSNFIDALTKSKKVSENDAEKIVQSIDLIFDSFKKIDGDNVKNGAEAFMIISGSLFTFFQSISDSSKYLKNSYKVSSILKSSITEIMSAFNSIDTNKVKKGAESFKIISSSILPFSSSLAKASIYLIPGSLGVILFNSAIEKIMPSFILLGKNEKKLKEGGIGLSIMSKSLLDFSKAMLMVSVASALTILFIPIIAISLTLMAKLFTLIAKNERQITFGARAIRRMGSSLVSFSIGLATFGLVSYAILKEPAVLLVMAGSIVLIGAAFALIGSKANFINKGSRVMVGVGITLAVFSLGYFIFYMATSKVEPKNILTQVAVLGGIGLVYGLVGLAYKQVLLGSLSFLAVGGSLIVFSFGYSMFKESTKDLGLKNIGIQLALLGGLGLTFGLVGLGVAATGGLAFLGPLFFAAVGGSLYLLAEGLGAIKNLKFTEKDSKDLSLALGAIRLAFLGSDGKNEGFFAKLGGVFTGAIDSVRMMEAAAGFAAAGLSLSSLSKGLSSFKSIKWDLEYSKNLGVALSGITAAFAQAGGEPSNPGGIFGLVFGNTFSHNAVERGIDSVMKAGKALTGIAKGLKSFHELIKSEIVFGEPNNEGKYEKGTLGYAITNTLGFIQSAFAAVGSEGNVKAGGFWGSLLGIERNKVKEGIKSTRGAGRSLIDIATGLEKFQTLVKSKINWTELGDAIKMAVGFVQSAFAAVASEGNVKGGGFWGSLLGIERNKVKEGIKSVEGGGKALIDIVTGLEKFQTLVKSKINWTELGDAIKKSLTFVGEAFSIIGSNTTTKSALFGLIKWDKNLVKTGIKSVKGAGEELINIGEGLQKFSDLKNPEAIADSIKKIFTSIGDTFTFYYEKPKFKSSLDHMKGFITQVSVNAEKGLLHKAADGMKKIAEAVNSIDKSKAEAFGNLFKGAGSLTENKKAYLELLNAVKEIENLLAGASTEPSAAVNNNTNNTTQSTSNDIKPLLESINSTLGRLNGTINSLPASIQAIQITVDTQ